MTELELGQATIVYEDPADGLTELTVDNEHLVYVRDHWAIRTGTDDAGNDLMRQIPRERVYYVERDVERFEEEAATVRSRVESVARDLRQRLPVGEGGEPSSPARADDPHAQGEPVRIAIDEE